jgi:hypothetical protein
LYRSGAVRIIERVFALSDSGLGERIVRLRREIDAKEAEYVELVRRFDRSEAYVEDGSVSTAAWLRHHTRVSHAAAQRTVHLGRALEQLPETRYAFAQGDISLPHAHAIADAATPARPEAIVELEEPIVDAAKISTPKELRQILQRITDALDGDNGASDANAKWDRRRLHVSTLLDGMVKLDGLFDPEGGEILLKALDDAVGLTDGVRTGPQQRADALVELVEVSTLGHAEGPGRRTVSRMSAGVSYERLEAANAQTAADLLSNLDHMGYVSPATLERIACDCNISRVITRGKSQPLDVGRSTRVVPRALWDALVIRDGGCTENGCDRPPGWCDVHHEIPWYLGGETNLENCKLKCRIHHRDIHEGRARRRGKAPP